MGFIPLISPSSPLFSVTNGIYPFHFLIHPTSSTTNGIYPFHFLIQPTFSATKGIYPSHFPIRPTPGGVRTVILIPYISFNFNTPQAEDATYKQVHQESA